MVSRMTARDIAERLSHRFVFRRRLPEQFGRLPLYVSTEAGLKYLARPSGRLDPVLFEVAFRHVAAGMAVWDVGSNVGLFALAAAARTGQTGSVLAFEPDLWLVRLLERTTTLKGDRAKIDLLSAAASDRDGVATFNIATRSRATNHIEGYGTSQTGGTRAARLVPTITLDTVLRHRPAPQFVKIDVEGAELLVLAGATEVLKHRPVLFCEVASQNSRAATAILSGAGYSIHDADIVGMPQVHLAPPATLALPG